jgi:hypothetical protein
MDNNMFDYLIAEQIFYLYKDLDTCIYNTWKG